MRELDEWLTFIANQHSVGIDMGLDRFHQVLRLLNLSRPAPQVITVAGTNGKGSTCVAAEALLLAHGVSVGCTLSPHIRQFNERIRLNGAQASDASICSAFAAIEAARGDIPLTYFEFGALAALYCMAAAKVQVAILEIGLGGRLDAFNAVDAQIAIITSIGLDHQAFLGDTLAAIGAEKAGILRAGQHVVLGQGMPTSVTAACEELALQPLQFDKHFFVEHHVDGCNWRLRSSSSSAQSAPELIEKNNSATLPLGALAAHNVALALMAVMPLVKLEAITVRSILADLEMPGRMQRRQIRGREVVHDVCHNPAGVAFLWQELARRSVQPKFLICCMLRDKDHAQVYATTKSYSNAEWAFVDSHGERALPGLELAQSMGSAGVCYSDMQEALNAAVAATASGDAILIFGSFSAVEQCPWLAS